MALDIALIVVSIVLNAAFAGSELALASLREGQLRRFERRDERGRRVARLARDPTASWPQCKSALPSLGSLRRPPRPCRSPSPW
jgi:CBS domain containing-hemolysin-like protein